MSSEFEVQVTEEFEVVQATAETVRIERGSPDPGPGPGTVRAALGAAAR